MKELRPEFLSNTSVIKIFIGIELNYPHNFTKKAISVATTAV